MVCFSRCLVALVAAFKLTSADCPHNNNKIIPNQKDDYEVRNGPGFCKPQGKGDWTSTMDTSAIDFPTFDGEHPNASYVSRSRFIIYDNACNIRGVYPLPESCPRPWVIEENFLPYVLTITKVRKGLGGGNFFVFYYANGRYQLGANQCVCNGVFQRLRGEEACPCAFPIHGEP